MAYTNREILSAVLVKWGQPAIESLTGAKLMQLPFLANLESKIRSTGWVSPMWSLSKELSPVLGGIGTEIMTPLLTNYLQGIPDESIPQLAHSIVNNALKSGGLSLMEGNIIFEKEDIEELAKLLRYNLPIQDKASYEVKIESVE